MKFGVGLKWLPDETNPTIAMSIMSGFSGSHYSNRWPQGLSPVILLCWCLLLSVPDWLPGGWEDALFILKLASKLFDLGGQLVLEAANVDGRDGAEDVGRPLAKIVSWCGVEEEAR